MPECVKETLIVQRFSIFATRHCTDVPQMTFPAITPTLPSTAQRTNNLQLVDHLLHYDWAFIDVVDDGAIDRTARLSATRSSQNAPAEAYATESMIAG